MAGAQSLQKNVIEPPQIRVKQLDDHDLLQFAVNGNTPNASKSLKRGESLNEPQQSSRLNKPT
jgi:hypothetical protein